MRGSRVVIILATVAVLAVLGLVVALKVQQRNLHERLHRLQQQQQQQLQLQQQRPR